MSGGNGAGRLALQGGLTRRPSRADATGQRSRHDPLSALGDLQAEAGNRAVSQLLGRGVPLEPQLREDMEARFGTGFEDVRVHDDPAAHAVAESMQAKAWARGGDIGFGRGRFVPSSLEGRELLAHELAHVVQQRRGGTAPSWERGASNELAADRAATAAVRGAGPVAVEGASGVGVARAEADQPAAAGDDQLTSMLNGVRRAIVERIVANAGYVGPGTVLVAKANEGVSDQLFQELWREGKGKALLLKFASLGATGVAQAFGGYQIGLVEGLLSPATDAVKSVFGLGVVAESARNLAWGLLKSAYNASGQIGAEIQQVLDESKALTDSASATMKALASDPGTLKWLMSLPEAANQFAQQQAYALGKAGASKVVKTLESPWEQKKDDAQPEPEAGLSTAAAWVYSKFGDMAGATHDWMFQSPGAKIGEGVGYAVGFVAVQVLLLATTAGSASIIEGAGVALAKVAAVVAKVSATAGKAVGGAAALVVMLGEAIHKVQAVMGRIGTAFKGAAVSAFDGFVQRSGSWLRALLALLKKLLGIAEKAEDKLPAPKPQAKPRIAPPANPTLVPPDTNGPTLVPDESFESAAYAEELTEPGLPRSRVPPPESRQPGTPPDAASSAAPADTPGPEIGRTPNPGDSVDFDSYAEAQTDPGITQGRVPSAASRQQGTSPDATPSAALADTPGSEIGRTPTPDDPVDYDSYSEALTDPGITQGRVPSAATRQQGTSPNAASSPAAGPAATPADTPGPEIPQTPTPAADPPRTPAPDSLPPYADPDWPANAERRQLPPWPSTPEQRARDRYLGRNRDESDPDFVDLSPRIAPQAPELTPGQQEGVEHARRGYQDAPPGERPAQEEYTPERAAAAVRRIYEAERPHRPSANQPAGPGEVIDAQTGEPRNLTPKERDTLQLNQDLDAIWREWDELDAGGTRSDWVREGGADDRIERPSPEPPVDPQHRPRRRRDRKP